MTWPDSVAQIDSQLTSAGVWHTITPNQGSPGSCREAAASRRRLGVVGIPLWDELKSFLGRYQIETGYRYVAVHCRAHQDRDDQAVAQIVGAEVTPLDADELVSAFNMHYGLVNPFLLKDRSDVIQLFDQGVLTKHLPPYTMMTNAGDRSWGIEFRPVELVAGIANAQVKRVALPDCRRDLKPPVLGILTGNGPESGMELWRRINAAVQVGGSHLSGDINYPEVRVASLPAMGMSMELAHREQEVKETVLGGIDNLADAGATVIGIACNTTQYFSPDIRAHCLERDVAFISMVDSVRAELRRHHAQRFDLIGIGPVVDIQKWSDYGRLTSEFEIAVPSVEDITKITNLAWDVKTKSGKTTGSTLDKLRQLLSESTQTDTLLIALTELSVVLADHPKPTGRLERKAKKTIIDALTVLAKSMADHYLDYRQPVGTTDEASLNQSPKGR